jgi:hypothetical protein
VSALLYLFTCQVPNAPAATQMLLKNAMPAKSNFAPSCALLAQNLAFRPLLPQRNPPLLTWRASIVTK